MTDSAVSSPFVTQSYKTSQNDTTISCGRLLGDSNCIYRVRRLYRRSLARSNIFYAPSNQPSESALFHRRLRQNSLFSREHRDEFPRPDLAYRLQSIPQRHGKWPSERIPVIGLGAHSDEPVHRNAKPYALPANRARYCFRRIVKI